MFLITVDSLITIAKYCEIPANRLLETKAHVWIEALIAVLAPAVVLEMNTRRNPAKCRLVG